jgi:hypothetical protein
MTPAPGTTATRNKPLARARIGWTRDQVRSAGIAARAAGWNEGRLRMVLGWFGNRAMHAGKLTRTSPNLNNDDFEFYMAVAEADAGGTLPPKKTGYWKAQADKVVTRQRRKIESLAAALGGLSEAYLNGVIEKATGGRAKCIDDVDQLNDRAQASKVIEALKAQAKRRTRSV